MKNPRINKKQKALMEGLGFVFDRVSQDENGVFCHWLFHSGGQMAVHGAEVILKQDSVPTVAYIICLMYHEGYGKGRHDIKTEFLRLIKID